jgi:rfaE bifunctional protein kinase chain/domain
MPQTATLPATERLLELVDAMAGQPILMLVDLVADRFISGSPKRISREAPVLILRYEGETFSPGGGANAVANVAALGGVPLPLGVVGRDSNGKQLLSALQSSGVTIEGILVRDGYSTVTKTRILGGARHSIKQQIVRFDIEEEGELSVKERQAFRGQLERWQGRARVAVLSDYGYGAVQPDLMKEIRSALAPSSTVLCDSRHRLPDFVGLDGATPNEEEALALLDTTAAGSAESAFERGSELLARLGARFLLITRGSYGMTLFEGHESCHIPVHGTDQVADVTGAGDTVIGTFSLALAAGATPLEASLLANYAGGVVVMKLGTATLTPDELRDAVTSDVHLLRELEWARS